MALQHILMMALFAIFKKTKTELLKTMSNHWIGRLIFSQVETNQSVVQRKGFQARP
jgi:hypothetical protein